ncbi:Transcriptional regulator, GntR family domain / Aspartate aminotransferase [Minicystis rosea]|nr:Transcriptional regulator, GntR family domain / Aspartate aminotransferase [Minicystis rosea]
MGTVGVEVPIHAGTGKRDEVKRHVLSLIDTGVLRRGARLPSILELSRSLDVAKNTVIGALDELCGEGVLEARERQGFFVKSARRRDRAQKTRLADLAVDRVAHGMATILAEGGDDFVPIGSGTTAESLLATPEWSGMLKSAAPRDPRSSLRYADPLGEPLLREVIAARHAAPDDGPAHVIITHGAVEALNLTFAAVAAGTRSRRIAIESPGYFMLAPIIEGLGLEPVPIPRDLGGVDLDRLRAEARRAPLAGVMINPNHHNPIGSTLSLAQRFELARLADEHRFWIIEDDVYKGLWTEAEEPPTIHSLLPRRTLYVGSFSKTLGPALRIGFIVAPASEVEDLRRRKFLYSLSGDAYTQNLVAEFVDRRGYQRHLAEVRGELARRARIAKHQSEAFASLGRFATPYTGGLFWRFELAKGIDSMALYKAAREKNVLVSPGFFFRSDSAEIGAEDAWMRVNVSRCEGNVLTRALQTLRASIG